MTFKPLLVAGGLATALVGLLFVEYHTAIVGNVTLSAAARHPLPAQPGASPDVALPAPVSVQDRVAVILARPLLNAGRRPPSRSATSLATGLGVLPRLTGVLVSPGGKSLIFASSGDGKPIVVSEGGSIGQYIVQSIGIGQAIVVGPNGATTLRPAFVSAEPSTPATASVSRQPVMVAGQPSILDQLRNGPAPSVGIPGLAIPSDAAASGAHP